MGGQRGASPASADAGPASRIEAVTAAPATIARARAVMVIATLPPGAWRGRTPEVTGRHRTSVTVTPDNGARANRPSLVSNVAVSSSARRRRRRRPAEETRATPTHGCAAENGRSTRSASRPDRASRCPHRGVRSSPARSSRASAEQVSTSSSSGAATSCPLSASATRDALGRKRIKSSSADASMTIIVPSSDRTSSSASKWIGRHGRPLTIGESAPASRRSTVGTLPW